MANRNSGARTSACQVPALLPSIFLEADFTCGDLSRAGLERHQLASDGNEGDLDDGDHHLHKVNGAQNGLRWMRLLDANRCRIDCRSRVLLRQ